jgi:hypothetical protein
MFNSLLGLSWRQAPASTILAYITWTVEHELLLRDEYLAAEKKDPQSSTQDTVAVH